ncbi:MAG: alpha/beta fold hydrolase [Anaerolineales bacterium]|nr:alpha/beta fold hydrolase [Chloroflexota bacterium]MBL6983353.1 alpha/beta fold hydrolase [Anaerolineales bacterium]
MPIAKINGVNLYYELHGPESAPVLVLNNGLIMSAATSWVLQTAALSRHYRLLQYDCRGQGQSDHPAEPYSMELHADDLAALLKELAIDSAHIAGISYGGEVAQAFALKYPAKTLSLILIDTVSEVGPELRLVIESWVDMLKAQDPLGFFHATVPWNFSPAWVAANTPILEDAKERYKSLDFQAVVNLCEAFFRLDFTARLSEIKVPTCIVVGELDLIKGPPYARIIKDAIPQAELHLIDGAGHASCWERPQEFNTIILGFLAKIA